MKNFALVLFIVTLFSPETNASRRGATRISSRDLCNEIQENFQTNGNSAACETVMDRHSNLPVFARNICADVIQKFQTDTRNARRYCESQFRNVHADAHGTLGEAMSTVVELPQLRLRQSVAADQCDQQVSPDYMCRINSDLILPELSTLFSSMSSLPLSVSTNRLDFSREKCRCVEQSVQRSNDNMGLLKFEDSLSVERARINSLIFDAAGKKLINDFASNLEDYNFFETNNPRVLGQNENRSQISCNQYSDFRNVIMDKCRRNGIHASVAEGRFDQLMNSLGDLGEGLTSEQSFNALKNDVMTYQLDPSKVFPGRSNTFTRQNYDRFRFGMYKTRPEIAFINDITDIFLHDETLGPQILAALETGTPPGRALYQFIGNEDNSDTKRLLEKYIKEKADSPFIQNLEAVLKTENREDFGSFLMQTWDLATDMHPGLKAIFNDKELFLSSREKMHISGSHSLLESLDTSDGALAEYFQERCAKIKNDFAEAACTQEADLMSKTNRDDLAELLSSVDSQLNPALTDVLLCRMPESNPESSIFTRLAFSNKDRTNMADYFLMKVNPENTSATRFSKIAYSYSSGDENFSRIFNEIAATGDAFRANPKFSSEVASTKTEAETTTTLSNLKNTLQSSQDLNDIPVPEQTVTNFIAPLASPQSNQNTSLTPEVSSKDLLKDFLADKENEAEIENLLKNTSKKDHDELVKLRSELEKSRAQMTALMRETEERRLAGLRNNVEQLEREVARAESSPQSRETVVDSESAEVINPAAAPVQFQNISKASESSGSTSSASGGAASGSSGIRRAIASEDSDSPSRASSDQAIIIEASRVQQNDTSAREDISKEVIAYLEKTNPDLSTLMQLKESGIIIKFKVLEQGREVVKEMKVDYSSLSPEAKTMLEQRLRREERLAALNTARRAYSYAALKHLLRGQIQSN